MKGRIIIGILLIAGICCAQVKEPVDSIPKQDGTIAVDYARVNAQRVAAIDARIAALDTSPEKVVADKIAELDKTIATLPDRKVTVEGRMTMKQYLQSLKADIVKDPTGYVARERARLVQQKQKIEVAK